MKIERRAHTPTEVRVDGDNPRRFEADVLTYGVRDSYDTIFDEGVFDDSLGQRLPKITWGHEWTDPIGRYVDWKNVDDGGSKRLRLIGELDDFDAVPRARQASAQLKSGTIDQFSVGFHREDGGVRKDDSGIEHFTRAGLDEVALVLVGAVPGTKLVSVRTASGLSLVRQVPVDLVVELGKKIAAGELSHDEAEAALSLAAGELPTVPPETPTDDVGDLSDAIDDLSDGAAVFAQ